MQGLKKLLLKEQKKLRNDLQQGRERIEICTERKSADIERQK